VLQGDYSSDLKVNLKPIANLTSPIAIFVALSFRLGLVRHSKICVLKVLGRKIKQLLTIIEGWILLCFFLKPYCFLRL
jgi:hypothetical protein